MLKISFLILAIGAIGYSCPIRLVPTMQHEKGDVYIIEEMQDLPLFSELRIKLTCCNDNSNRPSRSHGQIKG